MPLSGDQQVFKMLAFVDMRTSVILFYFSFLESLYQVLNMLLQLNAMTVKKNKIRRFSMICHQNKTIKS